LAERVFILRPDNLGDVVLFSGALRHLRARYPEAEIVLCVRRAARPLVEHCPHVDRLVVWEELLHPLPDWVPAFRGRGPLERAIRRLQLSARSRSDVVLVPVRSPSPAMHVLAGEIPARARFGIAGDLNNQSAHDDRRAEPLYTARLRISPDRAGEHELSVTRDFLRLLDIDAGIDELWPELWTAPGDRQVAEWGVPKPGDAPTLGLCPGVTAPIGKLYPPERYARVLEEAGEAFHVVIFGGPADVEVCGLAAAALAGSGAARSVINLAGRSTIPQLVEGLRRCDLVLGADAAAIHIAIALGKPTVAVLGGGHFGRFLPWGGEANRIAIRQLECYGCDWTCIHETVRCVLEISPSVVAAELREALRHVPLPAAGC
jgi:ADP-heptose:LPS heptosyltransferase